MVVSKTVIVMSDVPAPEQELELFVTDMSNDSCQGEEVSFPNYLNNPKHIL